MSIDDVLKKMNQQQKTVAIKGLMEKMDSLKKRYDEVDEEFARQKVLQLYKNSFGMLVELTYFREMAGYAKWYHEKKRGRGGGDVA